MLAGWHDYSRRGRMADNVTQPTPRARVRRGSRGVGRECFTIRTAGGRVLTIYFDRAPRTSPEHAGGWRLVSEETESQSDMKKD